MREPVAPGWSNPGGWKGPVFGQDGHCGTSGNAHRERSWRSAKDLAPLDVLRADLQFEGHLSHASEGLLQGRTIESEQHARSGLQEGSRPRHLGTRRAGPGTIRGQQSPVLRLREAICGDQGSFEVHSERAAVIVDSAANGLEQTASKGWFERSVVAP